MSGQEWRKDAACLRKPHLFTYSEGLLPGEIRRRNEAARTVCQGCPVLSDCRDWVLQYPDPVPELICAAMSVGERDARRHGQYSLL